MQITVNTTALADLIATDEDAADYAAALAGFDTTDQSHTNRSNIVDRVRDLVVHVSDESFDVWGIDGADSVQIGACGFTDDDGEGVIVFDATINDTASITSDYFYRFAAHVDGPELTAAAVLTAVAKTLNEQIENISRVFTAA